MSQHFKIVIQAQKFACTVEFLLILPVLRPTHGSLPISPLIDIPKGFSSKTTLEVPPRALEFRILNVWQLFFFVILNNAILPKNKN